MKIVLKQFSGMAFTTIRISTEARERLRKLKEPGDSFSDVILRNIPRSSASAGEMLEAFENVELRPMNPRRVALLRSGRGRRSNRPRRIAR